MSMHARSVCCTLACSHGRSDCRRTDWRRLSQSKAKHSYATRLLVVGIQQQQRMQSTLLLLCVCLLAFVVMDSARSRRSRTRRPASSAHACLRTSQGLVCVCVCVCDHIKRIDQIERGLDQRAPNRMPRDLLNVRCHASALTAVVESASLSSECKQSVRARRHGASTSRSATCAMATTID